MVCHCHAAFPWEARPLCPRGRLSAGGGGSCAPWALSDSAEFSSAQLSSFWPLCSGWARPPTNCLEYATCMTAQETCPPPGPCTSGQPARASSPARTPVRMPSRFAGQRPSRVSHVMQLPQGELALSAVGTPLLALLPKPRNTCEVAVIPGRPV